MPTRGHESPTARSGEEHSRRGATRAYVQVLSDNAAAIAVYSRLGFVLHHHHRYVDALSLVGRTL